MYKNKKQQSSSITINEGELGETIEQKIERFMNNNEPMKENGTSLIYTERKDGVLGEYDPRTDKWDTAIDAMDKVSADRIAKRNERIDKLKVVKNDKNDDKAEPTQGTDN